MGNFIWTLGLLGFVLLLMAAFGRFEFRNGMCWDRGEWFRLPYVDREFDDRCSKEDNAELAADPDGDFNLTVDGYRRYI